MFVYSQMRLKSSRLSECVGLSFTPLTSPADLTPHPLRGLFRHLFLNYGCFSFLKIKPLHYIVLLEVQTFKQFPIFFFFFAQFTFVFCPLSSLTPNSPLLCQRALFAPTVSSNLTSHLKFHLKFLASPCIPYSFLPWLPFI